MCRPTPRALREQQRVVWGRRRACSLGPRVCLKVCCSSRLEKLEKRPTSPTSTSFTSTPIQHRAELCRPLGTLSAVACTHLNLSLSSHRQDQRPIHHMRERVFLHHRQIQRDRYGGTASLTTRPTLASALLHLATASMLANAALAVQCACLPGIFAVVMISFDASIITNSLLRACGCSAVALRHELLLQKACNSLADHGHSTRPAN